MSETAQSNFSNDAASETLRMIQTQQRRCDEENGVLRGLYKRAKADGHNIAAMRAAIKASKRDPSEVISELRDQVRYMRIKRIEITRDSLFDDDDLVQTEKTKQADDIWEVEDAGYRAGRFGAKIEDCPFPPGSELHVHWIEWWKKGQEAIAREMGPDAKVASTSRSRPRQTRMEGTERKQRAPGSTETPKKAAGRGPGRPRKAPAKKAARRSRRSAPAQAGDGATVY